KLVAISLKQLREGVSKNGSIIAIFFLISPHSLCYIYFQIMLKFILLFNLFLISCTQKYAEYDVLHKLSYAQEASRKKVVTPMLSKGSKDKLSECFDKWFISSNEEVEKNKNLPHIIQAI